MDKILSAQNCLSLLPDTKKPAHDELLFIIVHQAYELWFKQMMHELESIVDSMSATNLPPSSIPVVVHRLSRVSTILKLMIHQFEVLETMTPMDFMDFRDFLFPASGFQSYQFRMFEIILGVKNFQRVTQYHSQLKKPHNDIISQLEAKPSLFDVVERWLERMPFVQIENFDFLEIYRKGVENMFDEDAKVIHEIAKHHPTGALNEQEFQQLQDNKRRFLALTDFETYQKQSENTPNQRHLSFKAMKAALMIYAYQEQPIFHLPFTLLQSLADLDENFTAWRYRHSLVFLFH